MRQFDWDGRSSGWSEASAVASCSSTIFLPVARDAPAIIALFDELRVHGFVEGQNLAIIPGGFQAGNEQIDDLVPTLVKAAPDAIIAGGDVIPRALQNATRTIPIVVITEDIHRQPKPDRHQSRSVKVGITGRM